MSNIQNFYQTAALQDFARVFQFRLDFYNNIDFTESHLVYVETAALPGRAINNIAVPYMGLSFNVPGTASYPGSAAYNVTFRCDQNYDIRSALEASTFLTFDEGSSTGNYNLPTSDSRLAMTLLNKQGVPVRSYTLFGAYIQSLADAAYDIKDTGTIQTVQATIAYQYWRAGTPQTNSLPVTDPSGGIPNGDGSVNLNGWA
jgi:hypothetical protein